MLRRSLIAGMAVVLCAAMPSVASAQIGTPSSGIVDRPLLDTFRNFSIVEIQQDAAAPGVLTEIEYYADRTGTIRFLLTDPAGTVTWVSEEITVTTTGLATFTPADPPTVSVGDRLGYYTQANGVIPYTSSEGDPADAQGEILFTPHNSGPPTEGQPLGTVGQRDRTYSFGGTIRPATKDQCKDGGWEAYGAFINQGDCVSYVATEGGNGPDA